MPNPNAIVGLITRIDPPVERPGAEMLRERPDGFSIQFDSERSARLVPGERAAGQLEILADLQRMQHPAYVEVEAGTRAITRLLIPLVAQIVGIIPAADGVEVELEISHARHRLRRSNPDFEELLRVLRDAQAKGGAWIVTETDDHEIIDVRPFPGAREPLRLQPRNYFQELWHLIRRWFWLSCISQHKANQMFDLVSATSCNPLTVPVPCIPFLYPDDGCWGRAHEMSRLMKAAGVSPSKVWIYGKLNVKTKNNPDCKVGWNWHVAPTLCVRTKWVFLTQVQVIDPALFTKPVSKATWKGVQGDPNAELVGTSASIFWRSSKGATNTDDFYTQTNIVLATYRLQLKNRSLSPVGPPPYAFCP